MADIRHPFDARRFDRLRSGKRPPVHFNDHMRQFLEMLEHPAVEDGLRGTPRGTDTIALMYSGADTPVD